MNIKLFKRMSNTSSNSQNDKNVSKFMKIIFFKHAVSLKKNISFQILLSANNLINRIWCECLQGATDSLKFDEIYQIHINKLHFNADKTILKNKLRFQVSLQNDKNVSKFMKNNFFKHAFSPKKKSSFKIL